jgi:hypothetical protein
MEESPKMLLFDKTVGKIVAAAILILIVIA